MASVKKKRRAKIAKHKRKKDAEEIDIKNNRPVKILHKKFHTAR